MNSAVGVSTFKRSSFRWSGNVADKRKDWGNEYQCIPAIAWW